MKCSPRCSGHDLRKIYFRFRQNGTPAGVPFCHFHEKGRNGKLHLQRRFPERHPFHLLTAFAATFPKGTAFVVAAKFPASPKGVPLGELALRSKD